MAGYVEWKFIVSTLAGVNLGEVKADYNRQVIRALNVPSTAQFTIRANNPLLANVIGDDLLVKAYRNGGLIFHGLVTSVEFARDDTTTVPTIAVTATDPWFRLTKRVAGKSSTGTLKTTTDRLTIAESVITAANSDGDTGVTVLGQTCGSTATYIVGPYRYASEVIQDMAQTSDGFDWRMDPIEYSSGKIANFKAAALLGSSKLGVVFEHEGRGNARLPHYQRNWADIANKAYHIPDEGPTSALGVREKHDQTSIDARGLYETIIDVQNLTNSTLRDNILADTVLVRGEPRRVYTFSPDLDDLTGRVPAYGTDYEVGDTIRARLLYNDVALVDGSVRLYKMQFDIDKENTESLTPTVVDDS